AFRGRRPPGLREGPRREGLGAADRGGPGPARLLDAAAVRDPPRRRGPDRGLLRRHHHGPRGVGVLGAVPLLDRLGGGPAPAASPGPALLAAALLGLPYLPLPSGVLARVPPALRPGPRGRGPREAGVPGP